MSDTNIDTPSTEAVAGDQLKSIVERIEQAEGEKAEIADVISDLYAEAKGAGYDVKIVRKIVALRRLDADEREEIEALIDTYKTALGMV